MEYGTLDVETVRTPVVANDESGEPDSAETELLVVVWASSPMSRVASVLIVPVPVVVDAGLLDDDSEVVVISCPVAGVDSKGVVELGSSNESVAESVGVSDEFTFSNDGIDSNVPLVFTEILLARVHSDESNVIMDGSVVSVLTVITDGSVSSPSEVGEHACCAYKYY